MHKKSIFSSLFYIVVIYIACIIFLKYFNNNPQNYYGNENTIEKVYSLPYVNNRDSWQNYTTINNMDFSDNKLKIKNLSPIPLTLNNVNSFVLQSKNIDLKSISDSKFPLVIIDYSLSGSESTKFTPEEISNIKNSTVQNKIVLSSINIGRAESNRWYWPQDTNSLPSWIGPMINNNNCAPADCLAHVKYWDKKWKNIIYGNKDSYVDKIIDQGFDGILLDSVNEYDYWTTDVNGQKLLSDNEAKLAEQEMIDFVKEISKYAKSKKSNNGFYIIVKNAEKLSKYSDYINSIDGIILEGFSYGYKEEGLKTPKEIQDGYINCLNKFKNADKPVLIIDYPFSSYKKNSSAPQYTTLANNKISNSFDNALANGYILYQTVKKLDYFVVNPGYESDKVHGLYISEPIASDENKLLSFGKFFVSNQITPKNTSISYQFASESDNYSAWSEKIELDNSGCNKAKYLKCENGQTYINLSDIKILKNDKPIKVKINFISTYLGLSPSIDGFRVSYFAKIK